MYSAPRLLASLAGEISTGHFFLLVLLFAGEGKPFAVAKRMLVDIRLAVGQVLQVLNRNADAVGNPATDTRHLVAVVYLLIRTALLHHEHRHSVAVNVVQFVEGVFL